jgi:dTMP kinase
LFQGKVLNEYDRIVEEYGLDVVNAVGSITEQQRVVRSLIARHMKSETVTEAVDEQPA